MDQLKLLFLNCLMEICEMVQKVFVEPKNKLIMELDRMQIL